MLNKSFEYITYLIIFIILLFGGIANLYIFEIIGFLFSSILFLIILYKKKNMLYPPGSLVFIFFISFQLISLIWTKNIFNSIEYLLLFLSSLFLNIFFYNFNQLKTKNIESIIIILGIIFGILFIFTQIIPIPFLIKILPDTCCSLYTPYSNNHNLIGDYWVLITVIGIYRYIYKQSLKNILLISISLTFTILSQSRSAFLSLLVALYLIFNNQEFPKKIMRYIKIFIYLILGIFIFLSMGKTTIFSRPYYFQGIFSLFKNPMGVGMGNFRELTKNSEFGLSTLAGSSAAKAHNIFLEVFSGIGFFGISFILWLLVSLKGVIRNVEKVNFLYLLIFVAISVNFFFNVTYAIPSMLWIWFISLAIIQRNASEN
ncbi:MAG: hypothetical protein ABIJ05_00525 [Patescibacteria group bacterium]